MPNCYSQLDHKSNHTKRLQKTTGPTTSHRSNSVNFHGRSSGRNPKWDGNKTKRYTSVLRALSVRNGRVGGAAVPSAHNVDGRAINHKIGLRVQAACNKLHHNTPTAATVIYCCSPFSVAMCAEFN